MTRSQQKSKERQIAQQFISILDLRGSLDESEAPDFIFHCDSGRKIGLEVTEYHTVFGFGKFTLKQIEVEKKKLLKESYNYAKRVRSNTYCPCRGWLKTLAFRRSEVGP